VTTMDDVRTESGPLAGLLGHGGKKAVVADGADVLLRLCGV